MIRAGVIIKTVIQATGVTAIELCALDRSRRIVKARHVAMRLCYLHTGMSYPEVARLFARADHTTVMHAVKRASWHPDMVPLVREIEKQLGVQHQWPAEYLPATTCEMNPSAAKHNSFGCCFKYPTQGVTNG